MNQSCSMRGRSESTTHTYTKISFFSQLSCNFEKTPTKVIYMTFIRDTRLWVFLLTKSVVWDLWGVLFYEFFFPWIFLPQPVITIATTPMCWCHLSSCLNLIIADPCERLWGLVCSVYQDHLTFTRIWKKKLNVIYSGC